MTDPAEAIEADLADQEAAQQAGDSDLADRLYRESMGAEVDAPEAEVADAYAQYGEGDSQPGTSMAEYEPYDTLTEAERDEAFEGVMSLSDPDTARGILEAEWPGTEYDQNVEFGNAALRAISGSAKALRVLEAVGVADHPDLVRFIASAGRLMAGVPGDPTSIPTITNEDRHMTDIDPAAFDEQTEALMSEQEEAGLQGNFAKRDRIERDLRALFVKRYGTGPAIGSSGGPTA